MKVFRYLRLLFRVPTAFLWTLLVHWFGVRLPQLFKKGVYAGAIGFWGKGLAKIMGVRLHLVNERTGPMGDLIIANHMGFLDIPALLSIYPAVFVIKMEMRRVFYFGKALERQGHVFVERDDKKSRRRAAMEIMRTLKRGNRLIVFPEGRASPGAERLRFQAASFAVAKRLGLKVETCIIDYLPDRRMLEWDVNRGTLPQLVDLFGRHRMDISLEFLPATTVDDDPEDFANELHDIVQGRLEQHDLDRQAAAEATP